MIKNKYYNWYYNLMDSRSKLNRVKLPKENPNYVYYELHHITPKSLGGSNDKSNLVLLTPQEHFVAHLLLTKFTTGLDNTKMNSALFLMSHSKKIKSINSKIYEKLKISHINYTSKLMTGHIHKKSTKLKISKALKGRKLTNQTKQKMSESYDPLNGNNFKGFYITPFGTFTSLSQIIKHNPLVKQTSVYNWCKNSNKIITKKALVQSNYLKSLENSPIGKSFNDLGFGFSRSIPS